MCFKYILNIGGTPVLQVYQILLRYTLNDPLIWNKMKFISRRGNNLNAKISLNQQIEKQKQNESSSLEVRGILYFVWMSVKYGNYSKSAQISVKPPLLDHNSHRVPLILRMLLISTK